MGWFLRRLRVLLQVDDSPPRVALAFAIGVFISFSPFLGIHTGLALAAAFLFRLNRVALVFGAWVNNPWTLAPAYTAGTLLGCALLGVSPVSLEAIDWSLQGRAFYDSFLSGFRPLLVPFLVGNLLLGALAAVPSYYALRAVLERREPPGGGRRAA